MFSRLVPTTTMWRGWRFNKCLVGSRGAESVELQLMDCSLCLSRNSLAVPAGLLCAVFSNSLCHFCRVYRHSCWNAEVMSTSASLWSCRPPSSAAWSANSFPSTCQQAELTISEISTGRQLPYGITQCYLPPDTSERRAAPRAPP